MVYPSDLFYLFRYITNANQANTWLSLKQRQPEVKQALKYYVATIGGVWHEGKYQSVFECDGDQIRAAKFKDGEYGWNALIRNKGCRYITAWDETQAKSKFQTLIQHNNEQFI